ncbi:Ff.00g132880.m01.CDS01 [Fusarium sp. VM40]|nr:Ff.00g132880.m01.CDS01 [Fusarium sp. VM40]
MGQYSFSDTGLELAIAVHITNVLSRMGRSSLYGSGVRPGDEDGGKPPGPSDHVFHQSFFLGGYGYSIKSSVTIPIALSILLVHVCIVLLYIGVLIYSRRLWLSSSWASFGELLVLALGSQKHDLGSVGGGVSSSLTWSTPVSVRVVGDEGKLEMVVEKVAGDAEQTCSGKGGSDVGLNRTYSRVESGMEYH